MTPSPRELHASGLAVVAPAGHADHRAALLAELAAGLALLDEWLDADRPAEPAA